MVVGPCRTNVPLCLGCNRTVDGSVVCSCSWPLCSPDCSELFRHSQEECAILSRDDPETRTCDNYRGILPLRILLLPNTEMQYFLQFMDHGDDREDKFDELVELVRVRWGLHHFPAELVRQVKWKASSMSTPWSIGCREQSRHAASCQSPPSPPTHALATPSRTNVSKGELLPEQKCLSKKERKSLFTTLAASRAG